MRRSPAETSTVAAPGGREEELCPKHSHVSAFPDYGTCKSLARAVLNPRRRYFLPPIIFYAGLSVKKKKFFRNFASIATLGILGTYILFAVIALGLFAISKLPNLLNLTVRGCMCCLPLAFRLDSAA